MKHFDGQDLALWRYGIISSLLHPDPLERTQADRLREIAGKTYQKPDGKPVRLSHETIRRWLYRFQAGGLSALEDETREREFLVNPKLADLIFAKRKEHPGWSLAFLFERLKKEGAWDGRPSRSALYRFCSAKGLWRPKGVKQMRAFEFENFGDLWVADFLHGPKVFKRDQKKKTYLHAILDDSTRYIVAGRFHTTEGTSAMGLDLHDAMRRFGIPRRFYTDNGAAYKSRYLKVIAGRMSFQIPHTPPYTPSGRGKIERFFRTVRERFLVEAKARTLADLNRLFDAWLVEYHQTEHGGIEISPIEKRLSVSSVCREIPDITRMDPLFFDEHSCRVSKTGLVRVRGKDYEVEATAGTRVKVFYLPWDPARVHYGPEYKPARSLDLHANAHRFDCPF
ncbi:MAG: DDE-type integrase/transposase/recombinase [Planctomycetota bacterium]